MQHQKNLEQHLEKVLPIKAIAHVTHPKPVSHEERHSTLLEWTLALQNRHGFQIGWIAGLEQSRLAWRHAHVALVARQPLDMAHVKDGWLDIVGHQYPDSVKAYEYRPGLGGLAYVMKCEDKDLCDVEFSPNIELFATNGFTFDNQDSWNAKQRRRRRRINELASSTLDVASSNSSEPISGDLSNE